MLKYRIQPGARCPSAQPVPPPMYRVMVMSGQGSTVDGMRWQPQLVSRHVILQIINDFLTFVRD